MAPRPWEPVGRYYLLEWWEDNVTDLMGALAQLYSVDIYGTNARLIRFATQRWNFMQSIKERISRLQDQIYRRG